MDSKESETVTELKKQLDETRKIVEKLSRQVSKYSKELGEIKKRQILAENVETQTLEKDFEELRQCSWREGSSIAEQVMETAESVTRTQGMVFEERTGMYYDYSSGYYYDNVMGMWYDGSSGTYFNYDEKSGSHSVVGEVTKAERKKTETEEEKRERRQLKRERRIERKRRKLISRLQTSSSDLEDGEMSASSSSSSSSSSSYSKTPYNLDAIPCLRIIVKESEEVKVGTLFIVTRNGGTLGREGLQHDVLISDSGCSKSHGDISFDESRGKYTYRDLGSRNGTWINGKRVSQSKEYSESTEISHGSRIQIGKTVLLVHIHSGSETCSSCEPGLVQKAHSSVTSTTPYIKEKDRKKIMKDLKKKYGLGSSCNGGGESSKDFENGDYTDRAKERRTTVGSDNPFEKTQSASLETSISVDNKGFRMLTKMGWSEGQGLGKESCGIAEPILVEPLESRAGLGASFSIPSYTETQKDKDKAAIIKKTQERFLEIEKKSTGPHSSSSSS